MLLLLDIGNTHTHLGLADAHGVLRQMDIPTASWRRPAATQALEKFIGRKRLTGVAACSVVPRVTPLARRCAARLATIDWFELTHLTAAGLGFDYPRPETVGPDRLANALAAMHHFGAPCVSIGFGTAVTVNVVNRRRQFCGGVIAPGLELMTRYLHERTALLPAVEIRHHAPAIGRSTEEAIRAGAVHGFRGLIREVVSEIKRELRCRKIPVIATGGYAHLIAPYLPEITAVVPALTLEGLRLAWVANQKSPT